ncbi:MAG TPA: hypothetical protein VG097_19780 [Gemmata sp.]|nr:hypothetical protein [Gemmata sp.]
MTTPESVGNLLEHLAELRARCPELRFGQLIATIGILAEEETGLTLWDVEDADFVAALERFAGDLAQRGSERLEQCAAPDSPGKS